MCHDKFNYNTVIITGLIYVCIPFGKRHYYYDYIVAAKRAQRCSTASHCPLKVREYLPIVLCCNQDL